MAKKLIIRVLFSLFILGLFSSCSIKKMALNSMLNTIAPSPEKKGSQEKVIDENEPNALRALTGEDDLQIVADMFPTVLKTYEMLYFQNPKHRGTALMAGQLYIMYANAFVQTPADFLPETEFNKKEAEYTRAKKFYRRGASYVVHSLETAYPNFKKDIYSNNGTTEKNALDKCKAYDAESLYWTGAGVLGAFALDPMDVESVELVQGAVAMLEKAVALDPGYGDGSIWEVLTSFYAAAPESLGGGMDKAQEAYKKALDYSKGLRPSVYLTYARAFAIPQQDSKGFDEAIKSALRIDAQKQPDNKLMITLSQEQARWLQEHKEDFILD